MIGIRSVGSEIAYEIHKNLQKAKIQPAKPFYLRKSEVVGWYEDDVHELVCQDDWYQDMMQLHH